MASTMVAELEFAGAAYENMKSFLCRRGEGSKRPSAGVNPIHLTNCHHFFSGHYYGLTSSWASRDWSKIRLWTTYCGQGWLFVSGPHRQGMGFELYVCVYSRSVSSESIMRPLQASLSVSFDAPTTSDAFGSQSTVHSPKAARAVLVARRVPLVG